MQGSAGAQPAPAEGRIRAWQDGAIFHIVIDRPAKMNGFSPQMLEQLARAFSAFEAEEGAHCGLLHAEGAHFTAGLELDRVAPLMASGRPLWPEGEVDPLGLRPPLRSKPLVAAVHGVCFTLGIELMLAADVVVAADDCRFSQLEVARGVMATGGATIRMPERAGWGNAMRWLLTGDEFDAETALRLGFVQEVVPAGSQFGRALALAERIAAQAPLAVRATLANARLAAAAGPAAAAAAFQAVQAGLLASEDAAEGVRSFKERRRARFQGR